MRAKMSDRTQRLPSVGLTIGAAEYEARTILAETEPDEPQTFLCCIERLSGRAKDPWTDALADALRAFVED